MKRVLCISDSLGLPRDGVDYGDTWIARLREIHSDFEFIANFRRNATTECLATESYKEYLLWYTPQIVILQLGICDCAPRYIRTSSLIYKIVLRLPKGPQKFFWKIYKKTHKRVINNADVVPVKFEKNIIEYFNSCAKYGLEQIIVIRIATPAQTMVDANPTINEAIGIYNDILEKISARYGFATVIDPLNQPDKQNYVPDGYHPNKRGNNMVAKAISKVLSDNV